MTPDPVRPLRHSSSRKIEIGGGVVDIEEILIGFVQTAVALVAFTTISVVVVQVSERTTEGLLALRLQYVLLFSIHLIALGILPLVAFRCSRLYKKECVSAPFWPPVIA